MRILVTGGSGFIGSHLIEELVAAGHTAASLDWRDPLEPMPAGVADFRTDFCIEEALMRDVAAWKPDVICHLGAIPSVQQSIEDPLPTMRSGVVGTWMVLEAARRYGVRRVVFSSSCAVFGATAAERVEAPLAEDAPLLPLNPYALSKKMGEDMMHLWASGDIWHGPDTVSLRFFNVFGPRQRSDSAYASVIERFLYQWETGEPFTIVPDGRQRRDMVFVKDVARAVRMAAERDDRFGGDVINIGSGISHSVIEIADLIGGSTHPRHVIAPRPGEIRDIRADITKAKQRLGWEPRVSFADGIAMVKQALKQKSK